MKKRRESWLERAERINREEIQAGCSHGMPPDDIEAEIQEAQNLGGQPEPEWTEAEEAAWKLSRWGSEGEPK